MPRRRSVPPIYVHRPGTLAPGVLFLAVVVPLAFAGGKSHEPSPLHTLPRDTVTFTRDLAPILDVHCAPCHRPGGAGPFSVLDYGEVRTWGPAIAAAVADRRMPPWLPDPGRGAFAGGRRLTRDQIATIRRWVEQGMPRGDPAHRPPVPVFAGDWHLGPPDRVLEMGESYRVPADGGEMFRNFVVPVTLPGPRYVTAVELLPSNHRVLHHAMIMVDRTPASRALDDRDPEAGFASMGPVGNAAMPEGFFLGWTPGRLPFRAPAGLAWLLEDGHDLVLQFHLRPTGRPETISARVGLYFADEPPSRRATVLKLGSETIDIPPGDSAYVATDDYVLPVDVEVLGLYPHAHYLGRDLRAFALLPDDTRQWLIHIPEWDFNWQDVYRYREPVFLPRGSRIVMRYTYDNSAANPQNPHRPPRRVVYGPRSVDEMGDLWVQVVPRAEDDLAVLRRDVARKRLVTQAAGLRLALRREPRHPSAHRDLAGTLLMLGDLEGAIGHYREHLAIDPADGNAHYNLGLALQRVGRIEEAAGHFHEAARFIPQHAPAHNALGVIRQESGDRDEAVRHYREALRADPTYADAHHNLGLALVTSGRRDEGLAHLREAVRLRPTDRRSLPALVPALLGHGDNPSEVREAVDLAERWVQLTGGRDIGALETLATAYAARGDEEAAARVARAAAAAAAAAGDSVKAAVLRRQADLYGRSRDGTGAGRAPPRF